MCPTSFVCFFTALFACTIASSAITTLANETHQGTMSATREKCFIGIKQFEVAKLLFRLFVLW